METTKKGAIGIFDSGYGGLTILRYLQKVLPQYDYLYLGDNARAPYGSHSYEVIYQYSREAVSFLFAQGCPLIIFACNTASAKALRCIQKTDLVKSSDPSRRVLGVIRPVIEHLGQLPNGTHVGLVGTKATISSNSYGVEAEKYAPNIHLTQMATPMWVPLIENGELDGNEGVKYFLKRDLDKLLSIDPKISYIQLACTHYPLLMPIINELLPEGLNAIGQGDILAQSLKKYLLRHPEMEKRLSTGGQTKYCTTEEKDLFNELASIFLGEEIASDAITHVTLSPIVNI
ncbi:glutamate racemase [Porphyromonadaceae bacterium W3.11]|nr:glutamate racemase [Porphyromonadaceae bacterium W3.11]